MEVKQRVMVRRRKDGRGKVYTDGRNARWNGSICPQCRYRTSAPFHLATYLATKPTATWPKAERAQWLVVSKLHAKGVTILGIERGASGSLIHYKTAELDEPRRMVVKVVRRTTHGMTYTISPVRKGQRQAERIALVFPNRTVKVVDMRAHLKACSKSGVRTVTELAKEVGVRPPKAAPSTTAALLAAAGAVKVKAQAASLAAAERRRA